MLCYNRIGRGTYWRAIGFAKELVHLNYEVTLLAIDPQRKRGFTVQDVNGVNVVSTPDLIPNSGYDLWDVLNRIAWLRKRPFDLIHAFETRPVNIFPALFVQKRQQIPLITDWCDWFGRGGSVEQRQNRLLRKILRPTETFFEEHFRPRTAGTTVINHTLRQKAVQLQIPAENIQLLPNGANVQDFLPYAKQHIRRKLGLPQDLFLLGYTGAMFKEDAELMAATFDLVYAQHPHIRLLLIGYNNIAVEKMVADKTAVIHTGSVTYQQLTNYVAACDVGWLPLADNGGNQGRFPMKVNDFMAAGRPLIVSDVGDLGSFVQQHNLGYVCQANAKTMGELISNILHDPTPLENIGIHARHKAETEFSWPLITAKLAQFYERFL